jgi:predicted DNA-binding transcriptional regulator AlpA
MPLTLADLARDPARAAQVPAELVPGLLAQCAAIQGALAARLAALALPVGPSVERPDELLTVDVAAARLGTTADWLYRRVRKLPFAVRVGSRQIRFSARGIAQYIRQREGAA